MRSTSWSAWPQADRWETAWPRMFRDCSTCSHITDRPTRRPSNGPCCRCPGTGSRCERHLRRGSTALPAPLDVMERCRHDRYEWWSPKLKEMVPPLGTEVSTESALFEVVWSGGT